MSLHDRLFRYKLQEAANRRFHRYCSAHKRHGRRIICTSCARTFCPVCHPRGCNRRDCPTNHRVIVVKTVKNQAKPPSPVSIPRPRLRLQITKNPKVIRIPRAQLDPSSLPIVDANGKMIRQGKDLIYPFDLDTSPPAFQTACRDWVDRMKSLNLVLIHVRPSTLPHALWSTSFVYTGVDYHPLTDLPTPPKMDITSLTQSFGTGGVGIGIKGTGSNSLYRVPTVHIVLSRSV